MARNFLAVSPDDINKKLAESIKSREMEIASYDFEQAHHETCIAEFGSIAWDGSTEKYKTLDRDAMIARAIADGLNSPLIKKISDLHALEYHKRNLEAVKIELAKSERSYQSLLNSLPEGEIRNAALESLNEKK